METNQADIELWNSFKAGDEAAFGVLFKQFYELLYQYGSKLCPNKELLEDCLQDLFLELWLSKSTTPVLSVRVYLLKAVKYKIFRVLGGTNSHPKEVKLPEDMVFEISHENFLVAQEEQKGQLNKVIAALQQLSHRQKEIIYLKIYKNLEYDEVAELMQINYQAARNLLYQAIKSLKEHFKSAPVP